VALLVLAMARPQWGFTWEAARQKGLDIVVAVDTSKSMLAEDLKPNRLARAKLAALDLMKQAQADRLGVIAFAGGAFLQCPLTLDSGAFRQCINELDVDIIPQGGTALAAAIRTATEAFKDDENFKVLVLFTDGEDHDPGAIQAAVEASEAGMRIFTIGLGTEDGEILRIRSNDGRVDYVRDGEGQVVKSRLNQAILTQIAGAAQGFYLPLRGADTVDALYTEGLAPLPKSESEARLFQRYHEQYHWPLGLAILLLLIETVLPERRRGVEPGKTSSAAGMVATLAGLLVLNPSPVVASAASAARDYNAGNYRAALTEFDRLRAVDGEDPRLNYNAGAAAFRAGQYEEAIERYGQASGAPDLSLQEQAYYSRGNALYRAGEQQSEISTKKESWERAIKDYESALKLDPENANALFNLEFVKQRLQELEQQEQQEEQNQEQQDDPQSEENQEDSSQEDPEQQDQQDSQGDEDNSPESQDSPQEDPQDQQADTPEQQDTDQEEQQSPEPGEPQREPSTEGEETNETPRDQPAQPANLTPEQAAQLLDNMKGEEQMLPLQRFVPQPKQPPAKDW
jgi:Ca-activated chloride channel family protein